MAKRTYIEFDGFKEVLKKLDDLDGNSKKVTEKALYSTHKYITYLANKAVKPHYKTGKTEKSLIKDPKVMWIGSIASVEVGFDLKNGGLASIFLMYGTPKMKKDQNLYNAFFGKKTKDKIKKIQEEIFWEEIRRLER